MGPVSPLQATPKSCCHGSCFCCPGTFPPPTRGSGHKRLKNVLGQRSAWHCTWLIWICFSNRRMLFAFSLPLLQALRVKKQPPPSRAVTLWARTRVRAPTSGLPSPLPAAMEQLHSGSCCLAVLGLPCTPLPCCTSLKKGRGSRVFVEKPDHALASVALSPGVNVPALNHGVWGTWAGGGGNKLQCWGCSELPSDPSGASEQGSVPRCFPVSRSWGRALQPQQSRPASSPSCRASTGRHQAAVIKRCGARHHPEPNLGDFPSTTPAL